MERETAMGESEMKKKEKRKKKSWLHDGYH